MGGCWYKIFFSAVIDVNDVETLLKICSGKLECGHIFEDFPWNTRNARVDTRGIKLPIYLDVISAKYLSNKPLYRMCKLTNTFFSQSIVILILHH